MIQKETPGGIEWKTNSCSLTGYSRRAKIADFCADWPVNVKLTGRMRTNLRAKLA